MPAEVEFVPAAQRTTLQPSTRVDPLTGDVIVVVGRKKDKKKRDKGLKHLPSEPSSASGSRVSLSAPDPNEEEQQKDDGDDEVMAFDYSSVPNILDDDDNDEHAKVGQKRSKKQKQKGGDKGEKGNKRAKGKFIKAMFSNTVFP